MSDVPKTVEVPLAALADLAVVSWRLQGWLSHDTMAPPGSVAVVRHAGRHLQEFLRTNQVEVLDLTRQTYDPGLAVEVVDTEGGRDTYNTPSIIIEMISPIVTYDRNVIKSGQVVTGIESTIKEG